MSDVDNTVLLAASQWLVPALGTHPAAAELDGYDYLVRRALAARPDLEGVLVAATRRLGPDPGPDALRELQADDRAAFEAVVTVVVGAYAMHPRVLAAIGYPGQQRDPAPFDQVVDELSDGILDPVLEAAPVIRPVDD